MSGQNETEAALADLIATRAISCDTPYNTVILQQSLKVCEPYKKYDKMASAPHLISPTGGHFFTPLGSGVLVPWLRHVIAFAKRYLQTLVIFNLYRSGLCVLPTFLQNLFLLILSR